MKRYVPIIIGIVALCAVLYLGSNRMDSHDDSLAQEEMASLVTNKSFQGSFTKLANGEQTLKYGFDLADTATATVSMNGALVKVTDSEMPVLAMYVSYEGERGYAPADYITKNIMTKVSGVTLSEAKTVGKYDWSVAESAVSVWHVASVADGKWLLVVESKKSDSEKAAPVLESLVAEDGLAHNDMTHDVLEASIETDATSEAKDVSTSSSVEGK
jgi:hypothetical protein